MNTLEADDFPTCMSDFDEIAKAPECGSDNYDLFSYCAKVKSCPKVCNPELMFLRPISTEVKAQQLTNPKNFAKR